jgi:hypothetical protein
MPTAVTIRDETSLGETTNELTLEFLDERVTVRELIRSRVYQEVTEFNARQAGLFKGLVQPRDAERTLGGFRLKKPRRLDWQEQYGKALEAFDRNGFLILLDDRQLDDLDEVVELRHDATVSFLRLVPLIGG